MKGNSKWTFISKDLCNGRPYWWRTLAYGQYVVMAEKTKKGWRAMYSTCQGERFVKVCTVKEPEQAKKVAENALKAYLEKLQQAI